MFYGCLIHNLSSFQLQGGRECKLSNPHQELTMGSSDDVIDPTQSWLLPPDDVLFPLSRVLCRKHGNWIGPDMIGSRDQTLRGKQKQVPLQHDALHLELWEQNTAELSAFTVNTRKNYSLLKKCAGVWISPSATIRHVYVVQYKNSTINCVSRPIRYDSIQLIRIVYFYVLIIKV